MTPELESLTYELARGAEDNEKIHQTRTSISKPFCELFCNLVESWDLQDDEGVVIPITYDNIKGIPFAILSVIINHAQDQQAIDEGESTT